MGLNELSDRADSVTKRTNGYRKKPTDLGNSLRMRNSSLEKRLWIVGNIGNIGIGILGTREFNKPPA